MRSTGLTALFCLGLFAATGQDGPPASGASTTSQNYARLPLGFEKQAGAAGERFVARGQSYVIGLERGKATIGVVSKDKTSRAVSLEFAGSRPGHAVPGAELPGKINYIRGNDPRKWQLGISSYERVTYPNTYPGIDVVYYGNQQQLEFDLVVKPGANPGVVRLKIEGTDKLSIDGSGALNLGEASGGLKVALPQIYQEVDGEKKKVPGHYTIVGRDEVAFRVDPWDHTRPLVIDPTIVYSAIIGGGLSTSAANAIALDSSGNIFIAGYTYDAEFPTVNPAQNILKGYSQSNFTNDAFVSKVNAAGTAFVYSTFLGGSNYDSASSIVVDSTGAAWVTGNTESTDFPVMNAAQPTFGGGGEDGFLARFNSAGVLQFSTYLGGSSQDYGTGIAVDSSNNGYLTGTTYSTNFPTTAGVVLTSNAGYVAAFVSKYSSAGAVLYSTLLGGGGSSYGEGVAVDSTGNAYITGLTYDATFTGAPGGGAQTTNNGGGDAFVAKLNPSATALLYFTFLGGTANDNGLSIAVDASGDAYIAGQTSSTGLATANASQTALAGVNNGFAAELNPSGSSFSYVTYLGGNRTNYLSGMALDGSGNLYLTGYTDSTNFPTVAALQPTLPINGVSLFNSTDSGASFSGFDSNLPGAVAQISINPAGTSAVVLTEAGIFRTVNGGASWTLQYSGSFYNNSAYLARGPAVPGAAPTPGTLYAVQCCAAVYKSTDDGVTWSFVSNPSLSNGVQGVLADPVNAGTVYLFGGTSPYVFKSTDSGATFNPAGTGLPVGTVSTMVATTDGTLYAGTSGFGIYTSTNQGGSWVAMNTGLPPMAYAGQYSLSASMSTVYFADGGLIYETTNGGASWAALSGPYIGAYEVAASPQNPAVLYALSFSDMVYASSDGGATWSSPATGTPTNFAYYYGSELVVDPSNSTHVFLTVQVLQAGFVAKLNNTGSALTYSTYLGGNELYTQPFGIATDGAGNAFVTGYTNGSGFPITSTALPSAGNGPFITKISDATAACSNLTVSPASALAYQFGGPLSFSVVAPSGCAFSASTNQPWAVVTSGSSGNGVGTVTVQITGQSGTTTQFATLTVGSQQVTITLPGEDCAYSLDMGSYPVPAAGGTVSAILTATTGCPWAVTNIYSSKIAVTSGASGSGDGTINVTVPANPYNSTLNYYLTVGDTEIFIAQAAAGAQSSQTISFDAIPNQILGGSPFVTAAHASSGLAVGLASTTPAVCRTASVLVQLLSAGTCSITATQPGNGSYNAATPVTRSFSVSQANPSGTLTPVGGSPFTAGANPNSVVVGDFNGDGIPDLATANADGNNVTVLLGNGSGALTAAPGSPFAVGTQPESIVVGDFNGDGIQDLAIANLADNNVTVLLGNGSGGFSASTGSPFGVGTTPRSVAVGDFNGDGIPDLAIANQNAGSVTVLLGNGSGGFAQVAGSPFAVGSVPTSVVVGDFNADGIQDLATANNADNSVTVLLGNGSGGFTAASGSPFAAGTKPFSAVVGDFNGDGIADLALASNGSAGSVTVLLGNGSSGFTAAPGGPFAVGSLPDSLVAGDLNGDGIPDLATANSRDNNLTVLLGNGSGGFTAASGSPFTTGSEPASVVVGDFNGDGKLDLAAANGGSGSVTVLLGAIAPTGSLLSTTSPSTITAGTSVPLNLTVSDAVSAFSAPTGTVTFLDGSTPLGTASQTASPYTFTATNLSAGMHNLSAAYPGDTRSSGSNSNTITITVQPAQNNPVTITQATTSATNACPAVPAPKSGFLTTDSRVWFDFTYAGGNAGDTYVILWVEPNGTTYFTSTFTQSGNGGNYCYEYNIAISAAPAAGLPGAWNVQLLRNGVQIVSLPFTIAAPPSSQTITFDAVPNQILGISPFQTTAVASSGLPVAIVVPLTPKVCKVATGLISLVGPGTCKIGAIQGGNASYNGANAAQSFTVSQAKPSASFMAPAGSPFTAGTGAVSVVTADFNGDGIPDLAAANATSNNVTLLLGTGSGGFAAAPGSPFPVGNDPESAAVADFNGDGVPDLAVANADDNTVTVLLGIKSGGFDIPAGSPIPVGTNPEFVQVGDFNGDGIQDLAVANEQSNNVTVLLGTGSGGFTEASGSPFTVGSGPFTMVAGDFNGDGIQDLATENLNDNNVSVLLGNGSGGFAAAPGSPFAVGTSPFWMVVGDFNGDGVPDLAIANNGDSNITVLLGNGSGGFAAAAGSPVAVGSAPASMVLGDFNGDGIQDLAVASGDSNNVTLLLGSGTGGFTLAPGNPLAVGSGPAEIAVGDFNGDGIEDLATANYDDNNVTVLLGGAPVVIVPVIPQLTITVSPNSISTVTGGSVSASVSASGGSGSYTFSVSGQPAGVTLGAGSLSGSPTQAGIFNAAVTVTDTNQNSASTSITINVLGLATTALPNGTTGQPYATTIVAAGGTGSSSFSATGLPAGLSLTSYGYLTGTVKTAGTYPIGVTVSSGGLSVTTTLNLTIANAGPLSISSAALPGGTVNVLYSQALGATGGLPPYTWSVSAGTLPQGLSMNTSGIVSGTPTTPGSFSYGVQVTDTAGATATATVSLTIQPAPLTITTQSLPSGMMGVDYPQLQLAVNGGVSPYTWALGSGSSLPAGMTLSTSGVLSGVPGASGTFSIGVVVTDHANGQGSTTFVLTIRTPSPDLILTTSSLTFALSSPAATPPASQMVGVQSTVPSQPIAYTVSVNPAAPWLALKNGASTPDSITASLTAAALSLSPGPYQTAITATCTSGSCNGHTLTVTVSLTVTATPPELQISTGLLSFATTSAALGTLSQPINIQNAGGGTLGFASISCEAPWCVAGPSPQSLAGGVNASIPVTVDPSSLSPGFYRTQVDISSSGGKGSVPVTLFISANATLTLAPAGTLFSQPAGSAPGNPNGSFLVSVNSSNAVSFSAAIIPVPGIPLPNWLVLGTTSGSASSTQPGTVSFSIDPVAAAALAPGAYYGEIQISSAQLSNSPEDFEVVLNVSPANSPVVPDPEPGGLLFLTTVGGVLPPETVNVYSSSVGPLTFQASAATTNGGNWLSVTPATGSTSATSPGVTAVSVNTSGLSAGVYLGGVSYSLSATAVRTVNVTLIVSATAGSTASAVSAAVSSSASPKAAGCTPSMLVPAQTGLVNSFAQPAGWPTPLQIVLVNDCGATVNDGQVVATFSNGDPPLALALADPSQGLYGGTWAPVRASSQVAIKVTANAPGFPAATSQIAGAVIPNAVPVLTPNSTLHSFDPLIGGALAPGTIVAIYGQNLAAMTSQPTTIPLPTAFNGTSVVVGGMQAPIYFVSAGQINAQIPFELAPGNQYEVIVSANGALTTPQPIQLSAATPGLAAFSDGTLIAQHSDGTLVSQAAPARPGEYLVAYLAGLGDTTVPVVSGAASPSSPLAQPTATPVLTIDGAQSPILFAGLTPGLVGLYQLNFQVPAGLPAGNLTIVLSQDGQPSNQAFLPYQP